MPRRTPLFCNAVGNLLNSHDLDPVTGGLTLRHTVPLVGNIQFVWRHPTAAVLYAITSSRGNDAQNLIQAVALSRGGELRLLGKAVAMSSRANHMSLDNDGHYVLSAHPNPCELMVHRILPDYSVGDRVPQPASIDFGNYAHEARATPSGRSVILVDRGNDAEGAKPEDPGSLRQFDFVNGILSPRATVAPDRGFGFGARDVEFHPGGWLYASLERQNKLYVFGMRDDRIDPEPLFVKDTLEDPASARHGQIAGDLHLHPDGRTLYVANRGDLDDPQGRGESNIARFAINPGTGEPTLVATSDTLGFHPRTFSIHPDGRMLIAGNVRAYEIMDRGQSRTRPPSLTAFRIGTDGALTALGTRDVEAGVGVQQFWCGFVARL